MTCLLAPYTNDFLSCTTWEMLTDSLCEFLESKRLPKPDRRGPHPAPIMCEP
jgi:hypothetical protein